MHRGELGPAQPVAELSEEIALGGGDGRVKSLLRRPWFGPLVALVVVYALFAVASPDTFARPENLATMLRQTVVVAIASVGMTYVIVAGGIDLSVGSLVALTTVVVAKALEGGASPVVASAPASPLATVAGVVNGALVAKLGITPFIVTLGTMSALRGAAKGIADEQKIDVQAGGLDALMAPGSSLWTPPAGVWIAALTALLFAGVLHYTRVRSPRGRHRLERRNGAPVRRARPAGDDPGLRPGRRARRARRSDGVFDAHGRRSHRLHRIWSWK